MSGVALALKIFEDEEKETNLQLVADRLAEQSRKATQESVRLLQERNRKENLARYGCDCPAAKCYPTCPKIMIAQESAVIFEYLARTKPPDRREREPILHLPAPAKKGGGSKSGRKKKQRMLKDLRKYVLE